MSALDRSESFAPGRLWSLWEMIEHDAKIWLRVITILMRQISILKHGPDEQVLDQDTRNQVAIRLGLVVDQCRKLGLPVSETMVSELKFAVEAPESDYFPSFIVSEMETVVSTIIGELKTITVVQIRPEFSKYYRDAQPFGPIVSDKFPSTIKDIESGSKSLACGLGTSAVFHMMRVMEAGLKAIARPLGIPYAPSWESYIRQIDAKVSAKHTSKSQKWRKDQPFFIEVLGDLQAVKLAWRNPTMHIVRHYDQDEAEDVFRAVRRFMIRLSERFSEPMPRGKKRR